MFRFMIRDLLLLTVVVGLGTSQPCLAQSIRQDDNNRPSIEALIETVNDGRRDKEYYDTIREIGRSYSDNLRAIRLLVKYIDTPPSPAPQFDRNPLAYFPEARMLLTCSAPKVRIAIFDAAETPKSTRQLHLMAYVLAQLDQDYERPFDADVTMLRISREIKWANRAEHQMEKTKNLRRMIELISDPFFAGRDIPHPTHD